MKKTTLMIFSLLIVSLTFAQSKKDMEQYLIQHEEKIKNLESEIINIKTNLINTTTTLGLVSKSNLDLEKLVKEQTFLIEKMINKNDSLLLAFKQNKESDFVLTPENEEDSIILIIQSYLACKKWEDRLAYVLKPEIVQPYMKVNYSEGYKARPDIKNDISIQGSDFKIGDLFQVLANNVKYICKKTAGGVKIDWEASVGYNSLSLLTFKANMSSKPTEFRLIAKIGTTYWDTRPSQNTHWHVMIHDNFGNYSDSYISKTSVEGKKMYEILKDGKEHQLILEIRIESEEYSLITKFINEGWSKE